MGCGFQQHGATNGEFLCKIASRLRRPAPANLLFRTHCSELACRMMKSRRLRRTVHRKGLVPRREAVKSRSQRESTKLHWWMLSAPISGQWHCGRKTHAQVDLQANCLAKRKQDSQIRTWHREKRPFRVPHAPLGGNDHTTDSVAREMQT